MTHLPTVWYGGRAFGRRAASSLPAAGRLQRLRDLGFLEFLGGARYRLT